MIVAIDGPAGSGKTTTARSVAERLGFVHIDTGAMYRAVTLQVLRDGVSLDDDTTIIGTAKRVRIELKRTEDGVLRTLLNGDDVTHDIRESRVDMHVSRVSEIAGVRDEIVRQQRELGRNVDAVMEGRDIGTVVFPDAEVKVYLVASVEERAKRRQKELTLRGVNHDLADVLADIQRRDQHDSTRAVAPLKPAPDAIWIDTTSKSIDEQVDEVIRLVDKRRRSEREAT
ncbi:MAG TPA: (d)CMP kinase [Firmicutes bacterium]|nr:(d)CMP kinase [Bacillota bacterium]